MWSGAKLRRAVPACRSRWRRLGAPKTASLQRAEYNPMRHVGRLAGAERHSVSAGRLIHRSNECTDTVTGGNCQQIASGIVIADSADSPAFDTVLRGMIGKIHGSSSGFAASRQNIPQKFADADNKGFRIHLTLFLAVVFQSLQANALWFRESRCR